jgi:hypothetical protein
MTLDKARTKFTELNKAIKLAKTENDPIKLDGLYEQVNALLEEFDQDC